MCITSPGDLIHGPIVHRDNIYTFDIITVMTYMLYLYMSEKLE